VVDDDPKIVELVRLYLTNDGYRVLVAYDGLEALELARHNRPDLVLLDLMLPEAMLLNHLVDDLQDLSLAETGQLRLERQPVALADVVDRAVGTFASRATAGSVALQAHCCGVNRCFGLERRTLSGYRIGKRSRDRGGLELHEHSSGVVGHCMLHCARKRWTRVLKMYSDVISKPSVSIAVQFPLHTQPRLVAVTGSSSHTPDIA